MCRKHVNGLFRVVSSAVVFAAASSVVVAPTGCEADASGTTGKRVRFDVVAVGSPGARAPFTNALGWNVTLSKALLATGGMTFYDGATIFSRRAPLLVLGRTAYAHPGHYVAGEAKGAMLVASSLDLRADSSVVLGAGEGISGVVRSATFAFGAQPGGAFAGELAGSAVVLEGTATKGAEPRPFRVTFAANELSGAKGKPEVEGCAFAETDVQSDGRVTLTVRVEAWLDQVDFAEPDAVVKNALARGLKSGAPYTFAFEPETRNP